MFRILYLWIYFQFSPLRHARICLSSPTPLTSKNVPYVEQNSPRPRYHSCRTVAYPNSLCFYYFFTASCRRVRGHVCILANVLLCWPSAARCCPGRYCFNSAFFCSIITITGWLCMNKVFFPAALKISIPCTRWASENTMHGSAQHRVCEGGSRRGENTYGHF